MENIINKNKELMIITKFLPDRLSRFGSTPEEFLNKLIQYGFNLCDINEEKETLRPTDVASLLKEYGRGKHTNLLARR